MSTVTTTETAPNNPSSELAAGIAAEAITTSAEAIAKTEVIAEVVETVEENIVALEIEAEETQRELERAIAWQISITETLQQLIAGQTTQAEVNNKLLEVIESLHQQITKLSIQQQASELQVNEEDTNQIASVTNVSPSDPATSILQEVAENASQSLASQKPTRSWL